ncbi:hypothetical protein RN616_16880 [Morganella morganii]|uniref:hypothetical protein n=1 Tax=Morganella morganii TaxID=582 RepID=UPI0028D54358|nr:hypothetical protein [Morganella morganii]EKU5841744.1 hypothetical protein [Morganella morganii]WNP30166.1 hypothetical protein RN616_16880 [Morganella morganii]HDF2329265.1 hypothetical protein [Morganella morganii]
MNLNNKQFIFFIFVTILWGGAIFLLSLFSFFIGEVYVSLFMGGEFSYSFIYVRKSLKAVLFTAPFVGAGTWYLYYKK